MLDRTTSSHHIYQHPEGVTLSIPSSHGMAKRIYVTQALAAIDLLHDSDRLEEEDE